MLTFRPFTLYFFLYFCLSQSVIAQLNLPHKTLPNHHNEIQTYYLPFEEVKEFLIDAHIIKIDSARNLVYFQGSSNDLRLYLAKTNAPSFVQRIGRHATDEMIVPGHEFTNNLLNAAIANYPTLSGDGIVVCVKEKSIDTTDIDLQKRVTFGNYASKEVSNHATTIATLIGGAGNSHPDAQGVAPAVKLISTTYDEVLPEYPEFYQLANISIQNHSYGTEIENFYGLEAREYDNSVINNPYLLHVFSAGNSGQDSATSGVYEGLGGYSTFTGNFKNAKNVLTIGAIDSFYQATAYSSFGPTYDGRIKPEIVAYAANGSSESAAMVSGTAALLQELYAQHHNDSLPCAALIRNVLIATADDVGAEGIDFKTGYGNLNALEALNLMESGTFLSNKISHNQILSYTITAPASAKEMTVTLNWDDIAAVVGEGMALENDIDMMVSGDGMTWQPWVLNPIAVPDSLDKLAVRGRDSLNNIEMVTLPVIPNHIYTIQLKGVKIKGNQKFVVSWHSDKNNAFKWSSPSIAESALANQKFLLRWESSFPLNTVATLQAQVNSDNWQTIDNNIELNKRYKVWTMPNVFGEVKFKMIINNQSFVSEPIIINPEIFVHTGFDCQDTFSLWWNRAGTNAKYEILGLGEKYMETIATLSDTFKVFRKADYPQQYFAVKPIFMNNEAGRRSGAPNYHLQGVSCYFQSFFAEKTPNNTAKLTLNLGSSYQIQQITLEKQDINGNFVVVHTYDNPTGIQWEYEDVAPLKKVNIYRAKLLLFNGQVLLSDTQTIYHATEEGYSLFPNPVHRNEKLVIIAKEPSEAYFRMYDTSGRKVIESLMDDIKLEISTDLLPTGIYFYHILNDKKECFSGKIVVE